MALSWFSPSPCFMTSWQERTSRLIFSLVACRGSVTLQPVGRLEPVWERRHPEDCDMSAVSVTPGRSTGFRHPLRQQSASDAHRRQQGAVGALPFALLFWKETLSVQRVRLAQNQDCLLWIQLHVFFLPRVIFLFEDCRHIWLIFQCSDNL